jgi:hypothetical protein
MPCAALEGPLFHGSARVHNFPATSSRRIRRLRSQLEWSRFADFIWKPGETQLVEIVKLTVIRV